jgi:hypothetical protein
MASTRLVRSTVLLAALMVAACTAPSVPDLASAQASAQRSADAMGDRGDMSAYAHTVIGTIVLLPYRLETDGWMPCEGQPFEEEWYFRFTNCDYWTDTSGTELQSTLPNLRGKEPAPGLTYHMAIRGISPDRQIASTVVAPVGTVFIGGWKSDTATDLPCDGRTLKVAAYPKLAQVLKVPADATEFQVPNVPEPMPGFTYRIKTAGPVPEGKQLPEPIIPKPCPEMIPDANGKRPAWVDPECLKTYPQPPGWVGGIPERLTTVHLMALAGLAENYESTAGQPVPRNSTLWHVGTLGPGFQLPDGRVRMPDFRSKVPLYGLSYVMAVSGKFPITWHHPTSY